jgi:uncharacterized membrane protein YczE
LDVFLRTSHDDRVLTRDSRVTWLSVAGRLAGAHLLIGAAIALAIRSDLGAAPWDVFHVGIHRTTGLGIGAATAVTGVVAVAVAFVAGVRPGPATLINALVLGSCVDTALAVVPVAPPLVLAMGFFGAGLVLGALGTGLYLSAGLGSGPRDSLMVALVRRGVPVARARAGLELGALGAGVLLGGRAGVGTLIYAAAIGPLVQWGVSLFEE